jgi:hypothetical protein
MSNIKIIGRGKSGFVLRSVRDGVLPHNLGRIVKIHGNLGEALCENHELNIIEKPKSPAWSPRFLLRLIDCICKPDVADEIVGDLCEAFAERARKEPRYAVIWLWVQTARVVFEEGMKLLRVYTRARAGK